MLLLVFWYCSDGWNYVRLFSDYHIPAIVDFFLNLGLHKWTCSVVGCRAIIFGFCEWFRVYRASYQMETIFHSIQNFWRLWEVHWEQLAPWLVFLWLGGLSWGTSAQRGMPKRAFFFIFLEELALLWLVIWYLALAWAVGMGGASAWAVPVTTVVALVVAAAPRSRRACASRLCCLGYS